MKDTTIPEYLFIRDLPGRAGGDTYANKLVQKRLEPELKLINMETVEVEQIEWLLYPFIPFGKVTIIQGDPGEGKTTMVLQIIAKLTRGESILPDDPTKDKRTDDDNEDGVVDKENIRNNASSYHLETPVNVIYQTAEDGLGDTIKPRAATDDGRCPTGRSNRADKSQNGCT